TPPPGVVEPHRPGASAPLRAVTAGRSLGRMTKRSIFVVHSNAVSGGEDEYNAWYTDKHLDETLNVPGVVSATRYRISDDQMAGREPNAYRYLAIYECEGDVSAVLAEFERRRQSGELTY